jgi:hypothetical protein
MVIGLKTNSGHDAPQHSCCSGYKNTHYDLSTLTLKFSYLIEITASSFIINALLIKQHGFQLRGTRLVSISRLPVLKPIRGKPFFILAVIPSSPVKRRAIRKPASPALCWAALVRQHDQNPIIDAGACPVTPPDTLMENTLFAFARQR